MHSKQTESRRYASNNNIHNQPNKFTGQEHSVERLKSCIADLKKLATTKVKKTASGQPNLGNQAMYIENQYEYNRLS